MADGIIIIDKPQDWTSMDVCAKLRGIFHERRIGHAGTLDPMATGVLPVFVGRATRAVEFASQAELEQVLGQFRGEIRQIPPMYSAIKVGGKKLYELARKGQEVERQPRAVTIHSLTLEEQTGPADYTLRVRCSKGTYVRTLCHDIGRALGCGGCMSGLRRTMAAGFKLEDALPLEQVLQAEGPASLLLGVDAYFADRPVLILKPPAEKKVRNGMSLFLPETPDGEYRVYGAEGTFLALSRMERGRLTTIKSFFPV